MSSVSTFAINSSSLSDTLRIAGILGRNLRGGEVIDLISDLGGGKTKFVRGLAQGIGSKEDVTSPSFTIKNVYHGRNSLEIHHFDFYRLSDAGIMQNDIAEALANPKAIVVVEWSEIVKDFLPTSRLEIVIVAVSDVAREFRFKAFGAKHAKLTEAIN